MKNTKHFFFALLLPLLAVSPAYAEGKLLFYNWFEYMPQELLDKFEAETGIEVTMDTYESNEALLAALKAGALGQYDLAVPGDFMVKILIGEGMLDSFEPSELKNFGNISQQWLQVNFDPGRKHSIPYQWGSTSFAVDREVYQGDISTTDILFNPPPELSGKINMFDTPSDVLFFASLHLGIPQCSADRGQLKALNKLLQDSKKHWVSFNADGAKDVLVSGDAAAGMIWNGFSALARAEKPSIEYAYPKQGYQVWMDSIVLLEGAPNRAEALKFMDFMLQPENAAALTNFARYAPGVKGAEAFLDDELRNSPESVPPADAPPGAFIELCDEATQKLYDTIWTNLRG